MMRGVVIAAAIIGGWYLYQRGNAGNRYAEPVPENNFLFEWFLTMPENNELRYFTPGEFREWWPMMSTELLNKLDEFRHRLGVPVTISPAQGALGRKLGTSLSQHNVDLWGEVRAVDVMFSGVSLERAYEVAKAVGFTGIGAYPDWQPSPGLHLDVRQAPLALWSGIKENGSQVYKSITEAFA